MPIPSGCPEVFIVFHEADQPWVEDLIPFLEAHDIRTNSELSFLVGDHKVERISRALAEGDHLLVVISPEAMADRWVSMTRDAAWAQAMDNCRERSVLPVVLHPAPPPILFEGLLECRLTARQAPQYRQGLLRLVQAIRGQGAQLKSEVGLPQMPGIIPLDAHWDSLIEVYGQSTRRLSGRRFLGSEAFQKGRLPSMVSLDPLAPALAANLYLTTLGSRGERVAPILEDLKALGPELRDAPKYTAVLAALEALLRQEAEAQQQDAGPPPPPATTHFEQQLEDYLTATCNHHRHLPLIGVNPELKVTLGVDDVYVPLKGRIHRELYQHDAFCAEQRARCEGGTRSDSALEAEPGRTDLSERGPRPKWSPGGLGCGQLRLHSPGVPRIPDRPAAQDRESRGQFCP